MELSTKAIRFLVEAVQYRLEWYERELARTDLSDDARSDLTNDRYYFEAILNDLTQAGQEPDKGRKA